MTWVVRLSCDHMTVLATEPQLFADVHCARCRRQSLIMELAAEYRVRCKARRCSFSKATGAALFAAQLEADKHTRRHPLHPVQILSGDRVIEMRHPKTHNEPLPLEIPPQPRQRRKPGDYLDEPPF